MEKLKNLKNNKKLMTGIIAIVVILAVALIISLVAKPSYKTQIKKFADACESDEKMEKYVKKYVNLRAIYAMQQCDVEYDEDASDDEMAEKYAEEFEKQYKKAKKSDYNDKDFIEEIVESFRAYASDDYKYEFSDIEKLQKIEDYDDEYYSVSFGKIDGMKIAEFKWTAKSEDDDEDDQDMDAVALFYKGKIILVMPDLDYLYSTMETTVDDLTESE